MILRRYFNHIINIYFANQIFQQFGKDWALIWRRHCVALSFLQQQQLSVTSETLGILKGKTHLSNTTTSWSKYAFALCKENEGAGLGKKEQELANEALKLRSDMDRSQSATSIGCRTELNFFESKKSNPIPSQKEKEKLKILFFGFERRKRNLKFLSLFLKGKWEI